MLFAKQVNEYCSAVKSERVYYIPFLRRYFCISNKYSMFMWKIHLKKRTLSSVKRFLDLVSEIKRLEGKIKISKYHKYRIMPDIIFLNKLNGYVVR